LFLSVCVPWQAPAHDIPADVTAQILVRPAGDRLQLVARIPLSAIRDVEFPERESGYLDVEKLAPRLADAAKVWIADFIEVREGDARLAPPSIADTRISLASDRAFVSFESALAQVRGPKLSNSANVVWNQVMLDVLLDYAIRSERSRFAIRPGLEGWARGSLRCFDIRRRMARSARMSSRAIREWCRSIPSGTRPRCASSGSAFSIFSMGPTTCCFCSASSFRSGGCGHCWWW